MCLCKRIAPEKKTEWLPLFFAGDLKECLVRGVFGAQNAKRHYFPYLHGCESPTSQVEFVFGFLFRRPYTNKPSELKRGKLHVDL